MAKKLSKSELDTPEFAERAAVAAEALGAKRQDCWDVGQFVWMAGDRGEILGHHRRYDFTTRTAIGAVLTVKWDDGSMSTIKPFALNR